MRRSVTMVLTLLALGCGDDEGTAPDGGLDAATIDGGLDAGTVDAGPQRLQIFGPDVAFVGREVCFSITPAQSATFIWGDGQRTEGGPEACHDYPFPGGVVVSAVTETEDASRTLRIVFEPTERRPTSSAPIVRDGDTVWVVTPDDDSLALIDATTLERTSLVETCARPRTLAVGSERVAVACQDGAALAIHDRATGALQSELALPAGSRPYGVIADPRDGTRFFVSLQDIGAVAVVSIGSEPTIERTIPIGPDVRALTMNDQGLLLASRWRAGPSGSTIYGLDLSDPAAPTELAEGLLPVQRDLDSDTDNSGVLSFLDTLVFTPGGVRAIVPALKANNVSGLFRTGSELDGQTTARAAFAEVFPQEGAIVESIRRSFDDRDYASALVSTAVGEVLYIALYGSQRVVALDAFSFDVVGSIANSGIGTRGVVLSADDERLFVWAELERKVRVYDITDLSAQPPLLATIDTVDDEPLDPQVLRGKQIFATAVDPRMSRTSYISCASCHLDGEGDNLVYDFTQRGEGLRNTISLQGSAQHFPLHWSGNFDEVQDFENDIRLHQQGAGFLSEADWTATRDPLGDPKAGLSEELDALAAYVASLTEVGPSPHAGTDPDLEAEGEALFTSAGCTTCHSGPAFTDGLSHDVGTLTEASGQRLGAELTALNTPALTALWRTAPYLHDGSAGTLRAVLTTKNPTDAHGTTTTLTEAQLTALEHYLLTL